MTAKNPPNARVHSAHPPARSGQVAIIAGAAAGATLALSIPEKLRKAKDAVKEPVEAVKDSAANASEAGEKVSEVADKASDVADKVTGDGNGLVDKASDVVGKASEVAEQVSGGGLLSKAVQALTGGDDREGDDQYTKKMRPIIKEHQDIGVPRSVAYNQWTQLEELPALLKAVESVEQSDEVTSTWTAKIGPVRREWTAEITEQVPDQRIAWRATGGADNFGVMTFHMLDDALTRVQVEMEYHPNGLVEKIGSLFLAPRKRARKELRLFKHYIELEGEETGAWRGEIRDAEVVDAGEEEQDEASEQAEDDHDRTRDELYERAKELGIEGRSGMSKAELEEAVREHE